MRNKMFFGITALLVAVAASAVQAGEVGGINSRKVLPGADAIFSVPFVQRAEGTFTAASVSSNVLTMADTVNLNQFTGGLYYVRVLTGTSAGRWTTILSNTANAFTVQDATAISGVTVGDTFKVVRHHTIASLFPDNHRGLSFIQSQSALIRGQGSEILIVPTPNHNLPPSVTLPNNGINKSASVIYFYTTSNNRWNRSNSATSGDNDIVPPQTYFALRNRSTTVTLTFTSSGEMETSVQSTVVPIVSGKNDVLVTTGFPVPIRLSQLDLGGTPAFRSSTSPVILLDELYVFPTADTVTGFNRSAPTRYFFFNGAWRGSQGTAVSADSDLLPAGASILIRRGTGTPSTATWTMPSPF